MMTRRQFLQASAGAAAGASLGMRSVSSPPSIHGRPNIIFILADDMGFSDIGCYGSEIRTPNIDRLAGQGIRFTHAYNAARCCPSRACLLTGLYPHQAGMGGMVTKADAAAPTGPYEGYLNDHCVTIAEVLRGAGYKTYMSGKWHVGEASEHWPRKRGFDRYFGLISGASSYYELVDEGKNTRVMALDDERYVPQGDHYYMTDAFTDFAVERINGHAPKDDPFFLYLAYTAPHWPMHALPEDIAKYRGKYSGGWDKLRETRYARMVELGVIDPEWKLSPRDADVPPWDSVTDKDEMDLRMAVYAAMIDRMDQGIGRVLDALKNNGMEDNTLVVFLSDNGGCHENVDGRKLNKPGTHTGERGSYVAYGRPWGNLSNTPFRMFKHWTHEGGISTPLIARWPKAIENHGALTHQVAHISDLMATCVDIAGAEYPKSYNGTPTTPLVGKSLAPIFRGKTRKPHTRLYWEHSGNKALREGKWKLVATREGEWELYDLDADRTELNNLAAAQPKRAAAMLETWKAWADKTGVKYGAGLAAGKATAE